jgi:ABC-type multidrug transport system fused ATPase/permease subunit
LKKIKKCYFKNVAFSSPSSRKEIKVLKNVTLQQILVKIVIVGPSETGKSTIASLSLRFYDIDSGEIPLTEKYL